MPPTAEYTDEDNWDRMVVLEQADENTPHRGRYVLSVTDRAWQDLPGEWKIVSFDKDGRKSRVVLEHRLPDCCVCPPCSCVPLPSAAEVCGCLCECGFG